MLRKSDIHMQKNEITSKSLTLHKNASRFWTQELKPGKGTPIHCWWEGSVSTVEIVMEVPQNIFLKAIKWSRYIIPGHSKEAKTFIDVHTHAYWSIAHKDQVMKVARGQTSGEWTKKNHVPYMHTHMHTMEHYSSLKKLNYNL